MIALLYGAVLRGDFVFDSRVIVLDDPRLRAVTAEHLHQIFGRSYWWPYAETTLYRPLTTLSYLINYSVFGNGAAPAGYHVVNLLLHAANASLLFAVVKKISHHVWVAAVAAAVWAVHPIQTEAVTNIVGRADLLAGVGVLAGFYAHLEASGRRDRARWVWLAIACVSTLVGLFSKESAVAVVGVVVLHDLLWRDNRSLADLITGWLVFVVPAALLLIVRSFVVTATIAQSFPFVDNPILGASFWTGRLTALSVIGRYLWLLIWPAHLSADYSFAQIPLVTGSAREWLTWTTVAAFVAIWGALWRVSRASFFWIGAAAVIFVPASNLLFPTGTIMAERLMYLPSAFLVVPLIVGFQFLADTSGLRYAAPLTLLIVIAILSVRTVARNRDWRDERTLWTATVRTAPDSFKSHSGLAEALYQSDPSHGNLDAVIAEKEASLKVLTSLPDPAETSRPYREAAAYYLDRAVWREAHGGASAASDMIADYRRAAALLERYLELIAIRPISPQDTADARVLLSTAYTRLGQQSKSAELARQAESGDPFNPATYRSMATALVVASRLHDAAIELMTGFMVTGDQDLRTALIAIYRNGVDRQGCAVQSDGTTLNPSCEPVRQHLCTAALRASAIHRQHGRTDLADAALASVTGLKCAR